MEEIFKLTQDALKYAAAVAEAAAGARRIAEALHEAAQRSTQLTDTEKQQLRAEADAVFAGPGSQLSGR